TRLARKMVMEWGMSDRLGPQAFGRPAEENIFLGRDIARDRNYSEEVAAAIDQEVRSIIDQAYQTARTVLQEHWDQLEAVADALMEQETLNRKEFLAVLGEEPAEDPLVAAETAEEALKAAAAVDRP